MAFRLRHLLAAGALTVAAVMPGTAVHAQTSFDFFFQSQRHSVPSFYDRRDYGRPSRAPGYYYGPEQRYAPDITVKSPKYRKYVPDAPKRVSLDKVCQFKLSSNAEAGPVPAEPSFAATCAAAPTLSLRVLPQVGAALNDYYSSHPKFLWVEDDAVSGKARAVMAALALSGRHGLTPADYRVALPAAENGNSAAHTKATMRFELTLSAKVLTYVLDATRGRVDPNRMSDYYDLPRKKVDLAATMGEIAKSNDVVRYLDSRNPENPKFRALVTALAKARAAAPKQTIVIPAGTFIRPGERDPALQQVIAAIRQSSSTALKERHADTLAAYDGGEVYGRKLVTLVREFQREKGLNADGSSAATPFRRCGSRRPPSASRS